MLTLFFFFYNLHNSVYLSLCQEQFSMYLPLNFNFFFYQREYFLNSQFYLLRLFNIALQTQTNHIPESQQTQIQYLNLRPLDRVRRAVQRTSESWISPSINRSDTNCMYTRTKDRHKSDKRRPERGYPLNKHDKCIIPSAGIILAILAN